MSRRIQRFRCDLEIVWMTLHKVFLDQSMLAAVLIVKDGRVVFDHGYGVMDLRTRRVIDARTNFRLASVTRDRESFAFHGPRSDPPFSS